jgi:putative ABC transport system ATP-binding protein
MIRVQGVTKTYPAGKGELKAVDSADIEIIKGEFALIVGRSGSGKSMLLGIMGGLIRPTAGSASLKGEDIWKMSDGQLSKLRGNSIGFVFQFSGLLTTLTALENVMLPSLFSERRDDVKVRAVALMEKLGLGDKLGSYPNELSGGEMKRVAIARALINDPDILLADEPTGDLDVGTETEIMKLFQDINREGKTIVMVTHSPDLASYATSLFTMDKGHISRTSGADGICSSPRPETGPIDTPAGGC